MILLDYKDRRPIYEQVVSKLEELMLLGVMKENESLPSVRSLAMELSINPNTIQKAYRDLESEGYLYTIAGRGTFVAKQEEILDTRQEELLGQFDEVVEELFFLSVKEADLEERMKKLAKGGENQ
mgnify:CR=1 FL=1